MVRRSVFYSRAGPPGGAAEIPGAHGGFGGLLVRRHRSSFRDRFGVPVVAAKLAVESFLFFVNFAVQRLFIFRPRESAARAGPRRPRAAARIRPQWRSASRFWRCSAWKFTAFARPTCSRRRSGIRWALRGFERFAEILRRSGRPAAAGWRRGFWARFSCVLLVVLTAVSVGPQAVAGHSVFPALRFRPRLPAPGPRQGRILRSTNLRHAAGRGGYIFLMTLLARAPVLAGELDQALFLVGCGFDCQVRDFAYVDEADRRTSERDKLRTRTTGPACYRACRIGGELLDSSAALHTGRHPERGASRARTGGHIRALNGFAIALKARLKHLLKCCWRSAIFSTNDSNSMFCTANSVDRAAMTFS